MCSIRAIISAKIKTENKTRGGRKNSVDRPTLSHVFRGIISLSREKTVSIENLFGRDRTKKWPVGINEDGTWKIKQEHSFLFETQPEDWHGKTNPK